MKKKKRKKRVVGRTKTIRIRKAKVDKPSVSLSKGHKDQTIWISEDKAYSIDFRGDSPFERGDFFTVLPLGAAPSGPIRRDAKYKRYPYVVSGGRHASDPDVDIQQ